MDLILKRRFSGILHLLLVLHSACLVGLSSGCSAGSVGGATARETRGPEGQEAVRPVAADPLEATYLVEGREVQLHRGRAVQPAAPGAVTVIETRVFGRPEYGDLNGDGLRDAVLFLQHDPGGSGTFYYLAAALFDGSGWQGTPAILLGDRILPQGILIRNRVITVHYLGRRPDEPFSASPTAGLSKRLQVRDHRLTEHPQ